jgi:outer membrane receptor protein involved in Fe transport
MEINNHCDSLWLRRFWGGQLAAFEMLWAGMMFAQASSPAADDPPAQIIVTGERVQRSLKETSSSVAVLNAQDIKAASANRIDEMLQLVPNVQLGTGSEGPAIRGQDTTGALQALPAFLGGNRPRTTIVVDGRRTTYNEFVFGTAPLWDVERIEVFRSPQTTTQGQNSIAGAIFVTTEDPTFAPEGAARLSIGNYGMRQVSAMLSGPASGDVALRAAGDLRYARTTARITDRIEGGNPNHDVYGVARVKMLAKPRGAPGTRLLLTYTHNQSQKPQLLGLTPPFRARRDVSGLYGTFRINVDALTANLRQQIARDLAADVTVTGGDSLAQRLAPAHFGEARNRGRDWSAEAVLNWTPTGPLRAVGGISRTHVRLKQFIDLSLLDGSIGRFRDEQDSVGVFGEARVTLLPQMTLTAGLRRQEDRQKRAGALATNFGAIPLDYDRTFGAWLPKLSLAYDFNRRVRAGLLVQRAYNPGGTTLRFDVARPDNFEAERLWDYELFARAELGHGINAAANFFYYDIRNAQRLKAISIFTPLGRRVGFADLFNAPKARSYGAEAELSWRMDRRLSARLSAGLLKTKLVEAGPDYPEFDGNDFARSPAFSASAAIDWKVAERVHLSSQLRYRSSFFADEVNSSSVRVPGAAVVSVRGEYTIGRAQMFAYARNLFDKFVYVDRVGNMSAVAEAPREVGLGIETRF